MSDDLTRTHFYHADAHAFGGRIERPLEQNIPLQAPLSLPVVGGYAVARSRQFHFEGIVSIESATSQVAGSFNPRTRSWTTLASATLEGLNILNVVTADRVVAQISTDHPYDGYVPSVSFVGTQFVNLRINGRHIQPIIDSKFCDQDDDPASFPKQPCVQNSAFLEKVDRQLAKLRSEGKQASRNDQAWLQQRFPESATKDQLLQRRGMVLCSLVKELEGDCGETHFGHVITIPEFGKVFLGELLLDHNSFQLTMVRTELGCPVQGKTAGGGVRTNGSSYP